MVPLLVALPLLGSCRGENDARIDLAVIGAPDALADGLRPAARLGPVGQLVQAAVARGLVTLDEQGQVVPGVAERWIVTDDGDSYIFRLRDGTWPDGAPLTAENVAKALRQALYSLRDTPLGIDLAEIGEVRVMTDRVLELRLARPVPELLQLLAQPELGLWHKGQGSGPLEQLRARAGTKPAATPGPAQQGLQLVAIPPARLGQPQVDSDGSGDGRGSRKIRLRALSAEAATAAFVRGDVAAVLGGRFADLPLAQAAAGISRRALQIDPAPGLFGLAVVSTAGPLRAPEFREALAMALDRDGLGSAIGLTSWVASNAIVPPAPAGAGTLATAPAPAPGTPERAAPPAWRSWTLEARRAEASARVARWQARSGSALPPLRLAWPQGPGADAVFARLASDLTAVGLTLVRVKEGAPAELRLIDLVARYPGPLWYLNQLSCPARRTVCSAAVDAQLALARAESDSARRLALLTVAEADLTAAHVFLPLGPPVRWALVRPGAGGFAPNSAAFHPLLALAQMTE